MNEKIPGAENGSKTTRPQTSGPVVLAIVLTIIAILGALGGFFLGRQNPAPEGTLLPVYGTAPSYELTDQMGRKVNADAFHGKIQVVTFLDPYCGDFCPLIAVNLANFAANLRGSPIGNKVAFVAFNVDPWQTGAGEARGFLKEYGWNPQTTEIEFLTGSIAETKRIVRQGFHVAFQRVLSKDDGNAPVSGVPGHLQLSLPNPLADKAKPRYDIIHNDTIEIVDGKGRIRKIFDQGDRVSDGELMRVITALLPTTTGGAS